MSWVQVQHTHAHKREESDKRGLITKDKVIVRSDKGWSQAIRVKHHANTYKHLHTLTSTQAHTDSQLETRGKKRGVWGVFEWRNDTWDPVTMLISVCP